jgi:cation transport regulator ChaB
MHTIGMEGHRTNESRRRENISEDERVTTIAWTAVQDDGGYLDNGTVS